MTTNTASDLLTIEGLNRRDPAAMTVLYDNYGRIVYSVVYRILGNSAEAEEIVQEIFLRVWTRAHLIDARGALAPWILTIARNLAIDYLRSARGRDRHFESSFFEFVRAPVCVERARVFSDEAERLRQAFAKLTPQQRAVIELAYFEDLSQIEISGRLEKPSGTVKTWVRKALGTLRQSFDERKPGKVSQAENQTVENDVHPSADSFSPSNSAASGHSVNQSHSPF